MGNNDIQTPINIETPDKVLSSSESFSDKQIKTIIQKFPDLEIEQQEKIQKFLKTIEDKDNQTKQQVEEVIKQTINFPSLDISLLAEYIKHIIKKARDGFDDENISSYTNNLIGIIKTEYYDINQQDLKDKEVTTNEEKSTLKNKEDITNDVKNITNEEKKLGSIQITNLYKEIKNPEAVTIKYTREQLYAIKNQKGESLVSKLEDIFQNNGDTPAQAQKKALIFFNYHLALNAKLQQSKTNPKIIITDTERSQAESFASFLEESQIDENAFYHGLGIDNPYSWKNKNRGMKTMEQPTLDIAEKNSSSSESASLDTDLGNYFDQTNSKGMSIPPLFTNSEGKPKPGFDDNSLINSFPLPKDTMLNDFRREESKSEEILHKMIHIVEGRISFPLIEQSTTDTSRKQVALKNAILRYFLKANPHRPIPDKVLQTLYPPKADKKENPRAVNMKKMSRERCMRFTEQRLIIPLMKNNFTSPQVESTLGTQIKKGKLSYISSLMQNTPGLEDFSFKPSEITLSDDQDTIPLYLHGKSYQGIQLTIEGNTIFMTSPLENRSSDPNKIIPGKIKIGTIDNFQSYTDDIITSISGNIIQNNASNDNPQQAYLDTITDTIHEKTQQSAYKLIDVRASIAHGLSKNKVQNTIFDLMKVWDSDGAYQQTDIKTTNPFYKTLYAYEHETNSDEKTIDRATHPDTFKILQMIRNSGSHSAEENERLTKSFTTLQTLLNDKNFNDRITAYLKSQTDTSITNKNALLTILQSHNRLSSQSLLLFLQCFGTQPGKEENNTIDVNKFESLINAFEQQTNFSDITRDTLIRPDNPLIETIGKEYGPSADTQVDEQLAQLGDPTHTEVYLS